MKKNNHIQEETVTMLAEALSMAFGAAQKLGIDIGGKIPPAIIAATAKSKPETKREKVDKYVMLITTGKRMSKAEILNRI